MKERRKFLKYFFKEHHGAIPGGRQFVSALIDYPSISIYPLICLLMQSST
jgi:hypothetical protein